MSFSVYLKILLKERSLFSRFFAFLKFDGEFTWKVMKSEQRPQVTNQKILKSATAEISITKFFHILFIIVKTSKFCLLYFKLKHSEKFVYTFIPYVKNKNLFWKRLFCVLLFAFITKNINISLGYCFFYNPASLYWRFIFRKNKKCTFWKSSSTKFISLKINLIYKINFFLVDKSTIPLITDCHCFMRKVLCINIFFDKFFLTITLRFLDLFWFFVTNP